MKASKKTETQPIVTIKQEQKAIPFTQREATEVLKGKLSKFFGISDSDVTKEQIYKAVVMAVRDILLEKRNKYAKTVKEKKGKKVYYLCMEFLVGRSLKNNLYNLDIAKQFEEAIKPYGYTLEDLYEYEPDAGLGNGGLGRLAACFMDALASQDYPAMGYSIRYEYGLFKQKIVDGWQMELPDIWLPGGEVWLTQRLDKAVKVKFDGHVEEIWTPDGVKVNHVNAQEVEAVPYDMMISGKDCEAVSVLRLWRARSITNFDMHKFSQGDYAQCLKESNEAELISKVLYPSDNHFEGKSLRLKQQYFLVSASLQNILDSHFKVYRTFENLGDKVAIHINDTHPALCVPELMRLLMDEHGYGWDKAWEIVTKTVAYTNHTVMAEALYPGDWAKIDRMSIISGGQVRMANLSVIASHKVNGVSALHSEIIKESIFKDFAETYKDKFTNVTNGIAYRRWLCQSNPELCSLITDCIGDKYVKDASQLANLRKFASDSAVLDRINEIKKIKKVQFCEYVKNKTGEVINPDSMFDVQAKRMHEYKRQLLNAMYIIYLYNELKKNPDLEMTPKTFIFGAKAAPGYYLAKQIIKLICYLAQDINNNPNPKIREKLKVIYLEDYNVSLAERLMPATELSEQISLAGKEASGTGNMKFMINGALTIGTMDGANVEMFEQVGKDNIFIFGLSAKDVEDLWRQGYNASAYYNNNAKLQEIIEALRVGFNGQSFEMFREYLLTNSPIADPYMCMADFSSYKDTHDYIDKVYQDKKTWAKMSLENIAGSGIFSADRSIRDYANNIWNIKPIK